MKLARMLTCLISALALGGSFAAAQSLLQVSFHGTSYSTNSAGNVVTRKITERTWLQQFAADHGMPDTRGIALAYHIKASDLGDTLEVVNTETGTTLWVIMGFYFGESFGRQALYSGNGQQVRRLDYIYTAQNDHSLGSALITQRYFKDSAGAVTRTAMSGQLQWTVSEDASNSKQICSGNFTTGRVIK